MNKEIDSELKEVFDILPKEIKLLPESKKEDKQTPAIATNTTVQISPTVVKTKEELAEDDFEYSRKQLKTLIDSGQSALKLLAELTEQTQHPRCVEAMSMLIQNISSSTRELMDLHTKMKKLQENKEDKGNTTNNVLITTTEDIIKLIKGNK